MYDELYLTVPVLSVTPSSPRGFWLEPPKNKKIKLFDRVRQSLGVILPFGKT